MRTVIVGILLFLVPALVCLSSLLVKGGSMEKATSVAVFRSFAVPFVVALLPAFCLLLRAWLC
jgi:hypothetical protein